MWWSCSALFHWYRDEQIARGIADGDGYAVYAGRCRFCGKIRPSDLPMIQGRLNERIGDVRPIVIVPEVPLLHKRPVILPFRTVKRGTGPVLRDRR